MATPTTLQLVLDLTGIAIGSAAGALTGVRFQLHIMGSLLLGFVTGLGGALLRDSLLGAVPSACLTDWRYPATSLAAGLLAQRFHPMLSRVDAATNYADAVWLGLFSAAGALKAHNLSAPPLDSVLMGVLSGIGGGLLRDVLINHKPVVLTDEIYLLPALLAALVVVLAPFIGWSASTVATPAAALCTIVRIVAIKRGWHGPAVKTKA